MKQIELKVFDEDIQKVLVFEYFFLKKDLTTLSRIFEISEMDLRYFFYSQEAIALYRQFEEEFKKIPVPDNIDQLNSYLIEKVKSLLESSNDLTASGDLIEKAIPQILNLRQKFVATNNNSNILNFDQQNLQINDAQAPILKLDYVEAKLLTEEELKLIPAAKDAEYEVVE